jgi:hypothetical protein
MIQTAREVNMKYTLYNSVEKLLAPETLSALEDRKVKYVHCRPFDTSLSDSGSSLLIVETNDGHALGHYVLKRVSLECDWIMRVTEDDQCRSVTLWQSGLLDGLKPAVEHGIVACARDEAGWAILMRDLTAAMLPLEQPLCIADNERILAAMAATHATYWNAPELANPALGLCSLRSVFHSLSPQRVRQELYTENGVVRALVEGWEPLLAQAEPDVAEILRQLLADPQPLCAALARYPQTLIHGDLHVGNVGLDRTLASGAVMLDWQLAAVAPPTLDLFWYVGCEQIPSAERESSMAYYRRQLAMYLGPRFNESDWQPMLELGRLAHLLRIGGLLAAQLATRRSETGHTDAPTYLAYLLGSVRTALQWL